MRITPVTPFQLVYDGQRYTTPGDVVDVPDELATEWVNNGWADKAPEKAPHKRAQRPAQRPDMKSGARRHSAAPIVP